MNISESYLDSFSVSKKTLGERIKEIEQLIELLSQPSNEQRSKGVTGIKTYFNSYYYSTILYNLISSDIDTKLAPEDTIDSKTH